MDGDQAQIQQLLLNLATNARQAMPAGGRLRVRARSGRTMPAGRWGEIEVSDNGVGMDQADPRARVRAVLHHPAGRHRAGHAGGDQWWCRTTSGTIQVDSEPGEGTTVRVRLPLRGGAWPRALARPIRRPRCAAPRPCCWWRTSSCCATCWPGRCAAWATPCCPPATAQEALDSFEREGRRHRPGGHGPDHAAAERQGGGQPHDRRPART